MNLEKSHFKVACLRLAYKHTHSVLSSLRPETMRIAGQ